MSQLKVETTFDGARMKLPGRPVRRRLGGIPLMLFGIFFGGLPVTMLVFAFSSGDTPWWFLLFFCLFALPFIGVGLLVLLAGLWVMIGSTQVSVNRENLVIADGFGPVRFPRRFPLAQLQTVTVEPVESADDALAGKAELRVQTQDGKTHDFASGQDAELLESVVGEIGRYVELGKPLPSTGSPSLREQYLARKLEKAGMAPTPVAAVGSLADRQTMYKLPAEESSTGGCVLVFFALFWNGITYGVITIFAINGELLWFPLIFMSIFALIGLVLIVAVVHHVLARSKLHPPDVIVSRHPLCLGETFDVQYQQVAKSRAQLNGVKLKLICRERATYRQGTSTTTVTHDAISEEVEVVKPGALDPMKRLSGSATFQVPVTAMHTFAGNRNEIVWLIEVHVDVAAWPDYQSAYVLQVWPRAVIEEF